MANLDPNDGGMASRKLLYAVGTSLAIVGLGIAGAWFAPLAAQYQSLIGGLLGALGIYCGANVSSRYVTGKCNSMASNEASFPVPVEQLPEDY